MIWVILLMLAAGAAVAGALYYWAHRQGLIIKESEGITGRGRVSLLTESVAYVGAALVLIGSGITVGQTWREVSAWGHVWLFGVAGVFLLAVGLVAWRFADPAVQRLIGVAWFGSAACVATAAGLAAFAVYRLSGPVTAVTVGVVLTLYSTTLWLFRHRELEMVAIFTGLIITLCGAVLTAADYKAPWAAVALGMWALGIGWAVLAWRYPEPLWTTVPLAGAIALIAPSIAAWQHGWLFAVGIVTAIAALAVSFPLRNPVLLVFGAFALAGYVAAAIVRYFHHLLGIPEALTVAGVLLLGLALISARLRREPGRQRAAAGTGPGPDLQSPGHGPEPGQPGEITGHASAGHASAGTESAGPDSTRQDASGTGLPRAS